MATLEWQKAVRVAGVHEKMSENAMEREPNRIYRGALLISMSKFLQAGRLLPMLENILLPSTSMTHVVG
jgi:hypothetical protein